MSENDVIYTDDVGTAAVFREILSNANNEADDFSFSRSPAKNWKRRNTGRIGVGAFRTTLQIGSYALDNQGDKQPDFLLNLPGECSEDVDMPQSLARSKKEPQQKAPRARSRHTHLNRKRERRVGHQTQQIARKRSSKFGATARRRKSTLNAWPEPATAWKMKSCGAKKSVSRRSRTPSIKRKIHPKHETVSLKQVLRSLDPSKETKIKVFKSREAKPAWLDGLQQQVDSAEVQVVAPTRRKAAFGLVARLQKVLRAEDGDVARLKHQSLSNTGSEHGDIRRSRSQITLECLQSRATQHHHHCAAIVKQFKRGSKPCESGIPEEGTAVIAMLRHSSSSCSYGQGTLIRVYSPWHLIPAAITGEPPTLICTLMEILSQTKDTASN